MNSNTKSIQELLEAFKRKGKLRSKLAAANLHSEWPKIVGSHVAKLTDKIWVSQQVLHIVVNSSVLKNELQFHKEKIVLRVNQVLNHNLIKEVEIH